MRGFLLLFTFQKLRGRGCCRKHTHASARLGGDRGPARPFIPATWPNMTTFTLAFQGAPWLLPGEGEYKRLANPDER